MSLSLGQMQLEDELFLRGVASEMTPEKVHDIVYGLTGDKDEAEKRKEWRWLQDF
jgi:hypothetical protein